MTDAEAGDRSLRRSCCPVACGLDVFGDKWTLLVIRDLFLGAERFRDFASAPEGIPTNILSDRLARLQSCGIVRRAPASDGSRHPAYQLTDKGRALRPVLLALRDWALEWEPGTQAERDPGAGSPATAADTPAIHEDPAAREDPAPREAAGTGPITLPSHLL